MKTKLRIALAILVVCLSFAMLAQEEAPRPREFSPIRGLFAYGFLLQIAAVIHWSRKRPETFWLWIIIIGGFIGALAYFLIEGWTWWGQTFARWHLVDPPHPFVRKGRRPTAR